MFKTLPTEARVASLIPGLDRTEIQIRGAEIPPASGPKSQNIKQKQYWNKFNKDFFKKWSTSEKKKFIKKKRQRCVSYRGSVGGDWDQGPALLTSLGGLMTLFWGPDLAEDRNSPHGNL